VSIQKDKGVLNLNNLKNINELILKDAETEYMKFSLEKKTHKDTFEVYSHGSKSDKRIFITEGKYLFFQLIISLIINYLLDMKSKPLLFIDVNISENLKAKLEIFYDSNPQAISEEFCKNHGNILLKI